MKNYSKHKKLIALGMTIALLFLALLVMPIFTDLQHRTIQVQSPYPSSIYTEFPTPTAVDVPPLNSYARSFAETLLRAPEPTPFWIYVLSPRPGFEGPLPSGSPLYISLNTDWLWEANDRTDTLLKKVISRFDLSVDGQWIPFANPDSPYMYGRFVFVGEGYGIYDEFDRLIGEGWGEANIYFLIHLTEGIHFAKVMFRTNTGDLYYYTWAFNITAEDYIPIVYSTQITNDIQTTATSEKSQREYFVETFGAGRKTLEALRK
jgi:hypothetical protein